MKKAKKLEGIPGLSIPQTPALCQFRTKAGTLVATGYEKVQRDDDGVVRIHFFGAHIYGRNLLEADAGSSSYDMGHKLWKNRLRGGTEPEIRPAKFESKHAEKAVFLRQMEFPFGRPGPGHWKAAAAGLYVDGVPVYAPESVPEPSPKRR